ncbi:hypothetical protein OW666_12735 [Acinetobacter baumannii]|uniref:hypothetical protein n=1 Tax=Acinetobacter baumannii TaxID=470 RepID=UPI001FD6CA92|nr:hypothetical protein [Acinetobacter baumannii]MDK2129763.1 hypothetical protein [Acinetobacter baumannii]MDK2160374.1 hypothetical protein [Acinetobacter baumannii]MDK2167833.1 hypothetical protein [Acinetobacter baumannii]MDK2251410.1 hypothetical protein [Acinetobacter baumannii]MDK2262699.1 hypothetical protein [Acinetobacter baumannii]
MESAKTILEKNDNFLSVGKALELIKAKTDLADDSEVAELLIKIDINEDCIGYNQFQKFDNKPLELYRDNYGYSLLDKLLLEIAANKINSSSDIPELKNYAWIKKSFFIEFEYKTGIDLESMEIEFTQEKSAENIRLTNENNKLKEEIKKLEILIEEMKLTSQSSKDLFNKIFNEENTCYAPDLVFSIRLWEYLYLDEKTENTHTSQANRWIEKHTGYDDSQIGGNSSINRIREIATPFLKWGSKRNKNYKKTNSS